MMVNADNSKKRIDAAIKVLQRDTTTFEKIESMSVLLRNINPKIDELLVNTSKIVSVLRKIQEGDVIQLTVDGLPEETEQDKKRKKLLLLFVRNWKLLESEINRVRTELSNDQDISQHAAATRIFAFAKGPFGIITLIALSAVVVVGIVFNKEPVEQVLQPSSQKQSPKTKVIDYMGKKIPLSEVEIREGPDCDSAHYHAKVGNVVETQDSTIINDPGACAFGKLSETPILEE